MNKVYLLYECDATPYSELQDILIGAYSSLEKAEKSKSELEKSNKNDSYNHDICMSCPIMSEGSTKSEILAYCNSAFNKVPELIIETDNINCNSESKSPNDVYYEIKEVEVL